MNVGLVLTSRNTFMMKERKEEKEGRNSRMAKVRRVNNAMLIGERHRISDLNRGVGCGVRQSGRA